MFYLLGREIEKVAGLGSAPVDLGVVSHAESLIAPAIHGYSPAFSRVVCIGIGPNNSCNDDKIRFPAPVPVDARVRARAEVVSVDEKGGGWWQVATRFTLEVEGNEKPCFVGDSVTRVMAPG
jgi:hypothetical protein